MLPKGDDLVVVRRTTKRTKKKKQQAPIALPHVEPDTKQQDQQKDYSRMLQQATMEQKPILQKTKNAPSSAVPKPSTLLSGLLQSNKGSGGEVAEENESSASVDSGLKSLLLSSDVGMVGEEDEQEDPVVKPYRVSSSEEGDSLEHHNVEAGEKTEKGSPAVSSAPEAAQGSSSSPAPKGKWLVGSLQSMWTSTSNTLTSVSSSVGALVKRDPSSGSVVTATHPPHHSHPLPPSSHPSNPSHPGPPPTTTPSLSMQPRLSGPKTEREAELRHANALLRLNVVKIVESAYRTVKTDVVAIYEGLTKNLAGAVQCQTEVTKCNENLKRMHEEIQFSKSFLSHLH